MFRLDAAADQAITIRSATATPRPATGWRAGGAAEKLLGEVVAGRGGSALAISAVILTAAA
jgi:hypothetical protein